MSFRCEACNRPLEPTEVIHGLRYGRLDREHGRLIPAMESATTLLCGSCATMFLKLVYQKLNPSKAHLASIYK